MISVLKFLFILLFSIVAIEGPSFEREELVAEVGSITHEKVKSISENGDNCKNTDCGHENEHCVHHCLGLHYIVLDNKSEKIKKPLSLGFDKVGWYYFYHYQEPDLDPSLKPPLFS